MDVKLDVKLTGIEAAVRALGNVQPDLKRFTAPVIEKYAKEIASRAKAGANTSHPSNLFRKSGTGRTLTPCYATKKNGEFYWIVQTPGGEVGKVEAMAEFMASGFTPQGAALVRALNKVYGRQGGSGGGRILYAARDELEAELVDAIVKAVDQTADKVERSI